MTVSTGSVELVGFRWPWQTREDIVLQLLDEELEKARETRARATEITENVKREVRRRMEKRDERS